MGRACVMDDNGSIDICTGVQSKLIAPHHSNNRIIFSQAHDETYTIQLNSKCINA